MHECIGIVRYVTIIFGDVSVIVARRSGENSKSSKAEKVSMTQPRNCLRIIAKNENEWTTRSKNYVNET